MAKETHLMQNNSNRVAGLTFSASIVVNDFYSQM